MRRLWSCRLSLLGRDLRSACSALGRGSRSTSPTNGKELYYLLSTTYPGSVNRSTVLRSSHSAPLRTWFWPPLALRNSAPLRSLSFRKLLRRPFTVSRCLIPHRHIHMHTTAPRHTPRHQPRPSFRRGRRAPQAASSRGVVGSIVRGTPPRDAGDGAPAGAPHPVRHFVARTGDREGEGEAPPIASPDPVPRPRRHVHGRFADPRRGGESVHGPRQGSDEGWNRIKTDYGDDDRSWLRCVSKHLALRLA